MTWFPPTLERIAEVKAEYRAALTAGNVPLAYHIRRVNMNVGVSPVVFTLIDLEFSELIASALS
jgi:hypothetical protein